MRIFNTGYQVNAQRWPWQKHPPKHFGRFGGGWQYKIGVDIGGSTIILNLIWGMVRVGPVSRRRDKP